LLHVVRSLRKFLVRDFVSSYLTKICGAGGVEWRGGGSAAKWKWNGRLGTLVLNVECIGIFVIGFLGLVVGFVACRDLNSAFLGFLFLLWGNGVGVEWSHVGDDSHVVSMRDW
jgi:hypothetical protein